MAEQAPPSLAEGYARKVGGMLAGTFYATAILRSALDHPSILEERVREAIAELEAVYRIGDAP